jgi:hypothetical protein
MSGWLCAARVTKGDRGLQSLWTWRLRSSEGFLSVCRHLWQPLTQTQCHPSASLVLSPLDSVATLIPLGSPARVNRALGPRKKVAGWFFPMQPGALDRELFPVPGVGDNDATRVHSSHL